MVSPDNLLALLEGHNYYQVTQPDREHLLSVFRQVIGPAGYLYVSPTFEIKKDRYRGTA